MKKLIILLTIIILTGCNNTKKVEPNIDNNINNKKEINTSYNVNLDNIEDEYKEIIDKYLMQIPLNKINIGLKDAYASNIMIDKIDKTVLLSSVTDIYRKTDPLIQACTTDVCSLCYMDDCILVSQVLEKVKQNFNLDLTPTDVNNLYNKINFETDYINDVLKVSKVLSFKASDDLVITEKAIFLYQNGSNIDAYKTTSKEEIIFTLENKNINSKEVVSEALNNIDSFYTFKHTFKMSDDEYYWYSTEIENL